MNAPAPKIAPFKLNISRGTRREPPRLVIHGGPGIGKSTLASCAPDPIFLDLEHGTLQLDVARVADLDTWDALLAAVRALQAESHGFKTVVLDTLDRAEWLCWQHICRKERVDGIEKVGRGFGKGYTAAYEEFRTLARELDTLRTRHGMGLILIAHSKIEKAPNALGDEYERWTLKVHKQVAGLFYESFDAILFARLETFTSKSESGKVKGFGDRRVLETQESPGWLAKNRYRLPPQIPLAWDDLAAGLARGADELVLSLRAEIEGALDQLQALDPARAEKARAIYAYTAPTPDVLGVFLNQLRTRIAEHTAKAATETMEGAPSAA